MARRLFPNISLAAKCRILFSVAVLLILGATLYLPWMQMASLNETAEVGEAVKLALMARLTSHIDSQDWPDAVHQLERDWKDVTKAIRETAPMPALISVDLEPELRMKGPRGFLLEAVRKFRNEPALVSVHKFQHGDTGRTLRLAMAIRAPETDRDPNHLRGIIDVKMPLTNEIRQWSGIVLVLAGLSGGFLAILVFYLVTQRLILSPVRRLRRVAEQVTAGDTNVRAEIATHDEFEELADAFNDMLARINESHGELTKINRSLDVKLGELGEKNVALYEANKLKSEFIANVSHELRTPLGLIINFAELLRDAIEDPPEDKTRLVRYAGNILQNGRSLLELINDLLDLAKVEAGKIELHVTEFSPIETCRALVDFMQPLADKKGIRLSSIVDAELPNMKSDTGKMKQILYNLLSNAVKFTPPGGEVRVDAGTTDSESVWVRVSDTGPGIAEDKFGVIFEKFRQIDSSLTREHSGTGLGLAITKELVNMLGGTITVASEVGVGSRFTVSLPTTVPERTHRALVPLND
jgi:two-component system, NarL family, sensor histidine kinase BarA